MALEALVDVENIPRAIVEAMAISLNPHTDALAQVSLIVEYNGRRFSGIGLATDIVEAGVKGLIYVLNNTHLADQIDQQKKQNQQIAGV